MSDDIRNRSALPDDLIKLKNSRTKINKEVSFSELKRQIQRTNTDPILFVDSADTISKSIFQTGRLVSVKTEDFPVTIKLPDNPQEGFVCQIINYEGNFDVTVTSESGTTQIGNSGETSQVIRRIGGAISVFYQTSSGSPEYVIIQDSREAISNRITVTKPADLTGDLDSTKEYFIDGVIDMGSNTIKVPEGGLTITGYGFDVSQLISSEDNYDMFDGGAGDNGNLFITFCSLSVTGLSSRVFNIDNSNSGNEAVELNTVNFDNCTEIGTIKGYRQGLIRNVGIFGCSNGFTFDGSWSGGVRIETTIIRGTLSGATLFKKGATLVFGSRFFSNANIQVPSGCIGYDFIESNFTNDQDFQLQGSEFSGSGTYVNGIDETSTKSKWRANSNLKDTYVGAVWEDTAEAVTTVADTGTLYKLAGTTTYSAMVHFSDNGNNSVVYDCSIPTNIDINCILSIESGNNNQINVYIRQWDNSASTYINLRETITTTSGSGRAENVAVFTYLEDIDINDRIEVWVSNETAIQDITLKDGSSLNISERQS